VHNAHEQAWPGAYASRCVMTQRFEQLCSSRVHAQGSHYSRLYCTMYRVAPKRKPLPNYQKFVLIRIKVCNEIRFIRQIKEMHDQAL